MNLFRRLEHLEQTLDAVADRSTYAARLREVRMQVLERRRLGVPDPPFDLSAGPEADDLFATRLWRARRRVNAARDPSATNP
jgi:hypothetical protein